jgi:hypothetical protein
MRFTDKMVRDQHSDADGFIKGIFDAPEYLFAKDCESLQGADWQWMRADRSLYGDTHKDIVQELIALSKTFSCNSNRSRNN